MNKEIIKINNMSFKYNDKDIFKELNLSIYEGTFVSIIGNTSSGKSTLTKILSFILKAQGYINIDGYLLNDFFIKKIRRIFSVCMSNMLNNFIGETVKDDLAFTLENLQYKKEEIDILIKTTAKRFKLEEVLEKNPLDLSNSEKQKLLVASSIIHRPKILLLDNVLDKLNPQDKKLIFKILLEEQKKNNLTIILITNDLEDTLISNRIIVLDRGKIILDGSKEEIYKDDKLETLGFNLPFIVKLSHNLMLYDLLDRTYFTNEEAIDKLWK